MDLLDFGRHVLVPLLELVIAAFAELHHRDHEFL